MRFWLVLPLAAMLALGACGKKGDPEAPAGSDPKRSDVNLQKDRKN